MIISMPSIGLRYSICLMRFLFHQAEFGAVSISVKRYGSISTQLQKEAPESLREFMNNIAAKTACKISITCPAVCISLTGDLLGIRAAGMSDFNITLDESARQMLLDVLREHMDFRILAMPTPPRHEAGRRIFSYVLL